MAHFIHGSTASSEDGMIVNLDSSDDEGAVEMGGSSKAESSSRNAISNYKSRLPDNGLPRKLQKRMPEIDEMIAKLMGIFPQLSPDQALYQLLKKQGQLPHEMLLQSAIDHFLRHGVPDTDLPVGHGRKEIDLDGAGTSYNVQEQDNYEECSLYRLAEDFPLMRMSDLRQAFKIHSRNFTHAYRAVEQACRELRDSGKQKLKAKRDSDANTDILKRNWIPKTGLKLMRSPRPKKTEPSITCQAFEKEWDCLQKESSGKLQTDLLNHSKNTSAAETTNDACTPLVEDIECGCCCMEFPFEKMVQCADGHLFCFQCLRKHVEESTFGSFQARSSLPCMDTSGCSESIPMSEVQRTLPVDVIERYEQRKAQADIEQAKLEGLVYCPFCNFPCEVDKDIRVLECPNSKCSKASCIECKELSHVPLRCEEVEKKSETSLRRRIEEVMTKAVIRVCNSCKAELVKTDGCNKVTCRCGTTMCYICRETISKDYSHFCQHAREPGRPCKYCKKCGLWETELDDEVAVAARDKALKELGGKEPSMLNRNIGPPIKKQKESSDGRNPHGAAWQHLHQRVVQQRFLEQFGAYPMFNAIHGRPNAILALPNAINAQANAINAQANAIHAQANRMHEFGAQPNGLIVPPNVQYNQIIVPPYPIPFQPNAIRNQANRIPHVIGVQANPVPAHHPNPVLARHPNPVPARHPNPVPARQPNPVPAFQPIVVPVPPNGFANQEQLERVRNINREFQQIWALIQNVERHAPPAGIQFAGNGNQLPK